MTKVIKFDANIKQQILSLQLQRLSLGKKFERVRDDLYLIKKELAHIDAELTYLRKLLERVNNVDT